MTRLWLLVLLALPYRTLAVPVVPQFRSGTSQTSSTSESVINETITSHQYRTGYSYSASGHNLESIINTIESGLSTIIQDSDNDNILDNIDNCINIYNPEQNDYDFDHIGDECDSCDNLNTFINGNVYGDVDNENNYSIDIFDLLTLLDVIIYDYDNLCGYQIADITGDGQQNILDAISLIQIIMAE